MENIIVTEKLTKKYGNISVVDNVNLHVPKGKIYGLLGRNGAGKTSTMKMMLGLSTPSFGTVKIYGKDCRKYSGEIYGKIGSIIETPGFYANLTGYENLRIIAKLRGNITKKQIMDALKLVGLHNEKKKVFANYSLGMKQRLGIAASIMHEPELLILDEPINGLDPIGISEMRSLLSDLSRNKGITILISSHVLSEIEQIADVIGVMHKGRVLEEVDMKELHRRKRNFTEFTVSNVEKAEILLRNSSFFDKDANLTLEVVNEYNSSKGRLRIFGCDFSIPHINKILVESGISVFGINTDEENLEDYFTNIIGGGGIA